MASSCIVHSKAATVSSLAVLFQAGSIDFIFCDIGDRARYCHCHELAMQLLRVGGVVVYYDTLWAADPVLQHSHYPQMRIFNQVRFTVASSVYSNLAPLRGCGWYVYRLRHAWNCSRTGATGTYMCFTGSYIETCSSPLPLRAGAR